MARGNPRGAARGRAKIERRSSTAGGGDDEDTVAVPIFDRDGPNCSLCTVKFTTTNRRHHCRVNGELVCNLCSKSKCDLHAELGANFGKFERVCDVCMRDKSIFRTWRGVIKHRERDGGGGAGGDGDPRGGGAAVVTAALEPLSESGRYRGASQRVLATAAQALSGFLWKKGHTQDASGKGSVLQRRHLFSRKAWKKRWFVLRSDTLAYYERATDAAAEADNDDDGAVGNTRLGEIVLKGTSLKDVKPDECTFVLVTARRELPIRTVDAENDTIRPFDRENFALWLETLSARITQANPGGLEHSAKALKLLGGS